MLCCAVLCCMCLCVCVCVCLCVCVCVFVCCVCVCACVCVLGTRARGQFCWRVVVAASQNCAYIHPLLPLDTENCRAMVPLTASA